MSVYLYIVRCREVSRLNLARGKFIAQASDIGAGSGGHEGSSESENQKISDNLSEMWVIKLFNVCLNKLFGS